jgi:hypothetical protein
MPEGRRPDWFCIFPNWFEFEPSGLLAPVASVRLQSPSVVDAEKVLFRADWSSAGSGERPHGADGAAARVIDRLDVADPGSERAHRFRIDRGEALAPRASFLRSASAPDGEVVLDGGRVLAGGVRFELARDPIAPGALVLRTVAGAPQRLRVTVDGEPPREILLGDGEPGTFAETAAARIPPGKGRASIRIQPSPGIGGGGTWLLAHAFAVAGSGR